MNFACLPQVEVSTFFKTLGNKDRGQPLTTDLGSRAVLWGVGILEDAGRLIGFKSPVVRATIDKYTEDIAVDSQLIQKELGFMPKYDLSAGWREVV